MTSRVFSVRRAAASACGAFAVLALVPLAAAHAQQTTSPASAAQFAPVAKLFTLNQGGAAQGVISALMREAGQAYIIGPGVTGDLSVHISDVTLDTALDRIAQSFSPPLVISHLKDGTYIIRGGETGPTRLALSTPPSTVTVQQAQPSSPVQPISVSVVGGDPVATALELQIIALRVERKTGAAIQYGPQSLQIKKLDVQIAALEEQLDIHKVKAIRAAGAKPVKTAQLTQQPK